MVIAGSAYFGLQTAYNKYNALQKGLNYYHRERLIKLFPFTCLLDSNTKHNQNW